MQTTFLSIPSDIQRVCAVLQQPIHAHCMSANAQCVIRKGILVTSISFTEGELRPARLTLLDKQAGRECIRQMIL